MLTIAKLKLGRLFIISLPLLILACCTEDRSAEIIFDVSAIANKAPEDVVSMLGKPDSVYVLRVMGKAIPCQYYKALNLEIQYSGSRATDIVVYGAGDLPFDQTALSAFNLDYQKHHPSDYRRGSFIRWTEFDEFSTISFYNTKKDTLNNIATYDIFFKVRGVKQE